jgi:hypothetical protein
VDDAGAGKGKLIMQYKITEIVETVAWSAGVNEAPPELVTKAKALAETGSPATFGTIGSDENKKWVVLGISPTTLELSVVLRS